MKSTKANIKIIKILGIISIVLGAFFFFTSFISGDENDKTIIITQDSAKVIDNNEIWSYIGAILGVVLLLIGIIFVVMYRKHKDDEIEINNDKIICISCGNKIEFDLKDVDTVQVVAMARLINTLTIKRKSSVQAISLVISEPENFKNHILEIIKNINN